ncbi:MAG TPA: CRTAC1 family protein [Saprospiraceae bacterium]|nr:CRTAC1 family protein [Saprospiraceae bacterium]
MKSFLILSLLLFALASCKHDHSKHDHSQHEQLSSNSLEGVSPENAYMVKMLDSIYQISDPTKSYNLNYKMAVLYKQKSDAAQNVSERSKLLFQCADELLNAGKTQDAIGIFETFLAQAASDNMPMNDISKMIHEKMAIAYLRLGEQQNCVQNHTASSCIIPLQEEGFHTIKTGSEKAIQMYEKILTQYPDDLSSRWLLNIAYMTLGKYPQDVPKQWLIPVPSYGKNNKLPYFKDIATKTGLDVLGMSGGVNMEDFNNDGHLDIFVTAYGLKEQCRLFFSDKNGGYEDVTIVAGLKGLTSGLNTIHADYNNDGFVDIFIMRGGWLNLGGNIPNSLLKNNGNGTFSDVTKSAGVLSFHPTQTATWGDYDGDGWLDLYVGNESIKEMGSLHPNEFYRNNGDGTFTNVASTYGLDLVEFCKGVNFGDVNNDGLPDLYISVMGGNNKLFMNRGGKDFSNWKFQNIAPNVKIEGPKFSFPNIFFDYDNDGNLDLLVFGYSSSRLLNLAEDASLEYLGKESSGEKPKLYHNLGGERFEDVTIKSGFNTAVYAMGCSVGDVDNDGFPDVYAGTGAPDLRTIVPNRFFRNNSGKNFVDETSAGFGHIQKGHGVAMGDLDNDGDVDIYCVQGGAFEGDVAYNLLFENPVKNTKWVKLNLEGTVSNRSAIGARIQVKVTDKNGKQKSIYRWVGAGGTFGSSSLQQVIGLGDAKTIDEVIVKWPSRKSPIQSFRNIAINSTHKIKESQSTTTATPQKIVAFKEMKRTHHHENHHEMGIDTVHQHGENHNGEVESAH